MKKWLLVGLTCVAPAALGHLPETTVEACQGLTSGSSCSIGHSSGQCLRLSEDQAPVCVTGTLAIARIPSQERANGRPPARRHRVVQSEGLQYMVPADHNPITTSRVKVTIEGPWRVIEANGISTHKTGAFPNSGNPHKIETQRYKYRVPAAPKLAKKSTPVSLQNFGIGINGVPFDPSAAEWYLGNRGLWRYEALSGAVPLGVDDNYAHVQPNGAYHYHGLPTGLLARLQVTPQQHSPLIGWAADGFPIYALYGYGDGMNEETDVVKMHSSYRVKSGHRPTSNKQPGGYYDGTFVADYEYVEGAGSLDECNGRFVRTPDFPQGIYAYFLTEEWPIIPRCYKGTPSEDFRRGPAMGRPQPPRRRFG
ncbi:YHYH protein [Microbulbifer sp. TRSA005]|uniref:YHYH protein n=1 Tax=unclassified Microbulbifer TaxID=2619833 RepID=UPI00403A25F8